MCLCDCCVLVFLCFWEGTNQTRLDVKNAQTTEETRGSDMVAEGVTDFHTAHATSTPVMETSRALR